MNYCTDTDLLHWEPNLFRDAVFSSQKLLAGSGDLAGSVFTLSAGSLVDAHVSAEQVIVLTGAVEGCFPIVSVDSATQLTLSALYEGLPDAVATPVGSASGLEFSVRTFWPQIRLVSSLLERAAGVEDGCGLEDPPVITNAATLKRVCALGTLQIIYSALAAAAPEPEPLLLRAGLYERLYRRALRDATVELDTNSDGRADVCRKLNVVQLRRL